MKEKLAIFEAELEFKNKEIEELEIKVKEGESDLYQKNEEIILLEKRNNHNRKTVDDLEREIFELRDQLPEEESFTDGENEIDFQDRHLEEDIEADRVTR